MQRLLFLIPTLPLVSALILGIAGRHFSRRTIAGLAVSAVASSAIVTALVSIALLHSSSSGGNSVLLQTLWTWMKINDLKVNISFRFDALTLVMSLVITGVSFLIHIYSVEFMQNDEGYSRFFSYMNLFVASMLTLVLADDLLLLYLGWEGVGLCSYLLIGFWYQDPRNDKAAQKAFLITRIGDTAMIIGLFLLFLSFRTLHIQTILQAATAQWRSNSNIAITAAALLLGGALGKSAQLPLQTWLPDAMAGPTPVSALIHAATMVTAGVYLIARTHPLFELAPTIQQIVAIIGATTLIMAAFSALTQSDIKRILAYSTMSQMGYLFLALGTGAWSAAIFHLMTHAFFKALLFLSAGALIISYHHEQNIFKIGRSFPDPRRTLPEVFWPFLIGAASLSAFPWITSGFYSKDYILEEVFNSTLGGPWFWAVGTAGAFLTSLYTFRLVFVVFWSSKKPSTFPTQSISSRPGVLIYLPLYILSLFSILSGFINVPHYLYPNPTSTHLGSTQMWLTVTSSLAALSGILLAAYLYLDSPRSLRGVIQKLNPLRRFFESGWGFDWVYHHFFSRPFVFISKIVRRDPIDLIFDAIALLNLGLNRFLSMTATGNSRWYAAIIGTGAAVLIFLAEIL